MLARNGAHLLVLSSFAVAQPLYDLLGDNAEFFAVRGSSAREIVGFTVALALGPALVLLAVEALARLVGPRALTTIHFAFVAGLAALIVAQVAKHHAELSGRTTIGVGLAVGLAAAVLYHRASFVRSFATVLLPAPFVFAGLFLLHSPVEKLVLEPEARAAASVQVESTMPVVVVVFDEFPLTSLLTADGGIDAARYPNFAALAGDAHWFRNATTVHEKTTAAIPAILTGRYPADHPRLPILAEYPENLFTLLRGAYRMNVWETQTHLCPPSVCRDRRPQAQPAPAGTRMRELFTDAGVVYAHLVAPSEYEARLPAVNEGWGGFLEGSGDGESPEEGDDGIERRGGGPAAFRRFLTSIRPSGGPTLHFFHSMLPHASWVYTPSCRRSVVQRRAPGLSSSAVWGEEEDLLVEALRRHLLQVGCVDHLVGELVARLREVGLYDRAVLVVVSDHGVSVRPGLPRRSATPETLEDIAYVPLFVRVPGRGAGTSDGHRQTVDIFPTIADALGIEVPWRVDGRSLFSGGHAESVAVTGINGTVRMPASELVPRRDAAVRRLVGLFGSGDWEKTLHVGVPHRELLGVSVDDLTVVEGRNRVWLERRSRDLLADLPPNSYWVPTPIVGIVRGEGAVAGRPLAVAIDGRVRVVTNTYERDAIVFTAYVPESVFHRGRHEVEIFWVNALAEGTVLERIAGR